MAWAEVGSGTQRATLAPVAGVTSASQAFPSSVTSGHLLVVVGTISKSAAASDDDVRAVVSDSLGTTYTVFRGTPTISFSHRFCNFIAYGIAASSGANTVTVATLTGTTANITFTVDAFSGISTSSPLYGSATTGVTTTADPSITQDGATIAWSLASVRQDMYDAVSFRPSGAGTLLVVGVCAAFFMPSTDSFAAVAPATQMGVGQTASINVNHNAAFGSGSSVAAETTPVSYEDPCAITQPRIFAKVTTDTETIKIGVHPLRDASGFAEPRLIDVSTVTRVASDPSTGAWSAQTATMRWADTDRANRERSETRTSLRNCDAEIYLTSNAQRQAGGPPRLLFAGKIYEDTADANLVLSTTINDLIGVSYSLFSEEKQIPQREVSVVYFPGCPVANLGKGEPIIGGRRAPRDTANGQGVVEGIYVGQVTLNGTSTTPTGTTLADVVAALNTSGAAGTIYTDWGSRIGYGDAVSLQSYYDSHGTVPSDYDALAAIIGYSDLDALLAQTAVTGGSTFEAVLVASHAITEVLDGANGNPSIWIDDTQIDPAQLGVSVWCPQIPGDTTWASDISTDPYTDILGTDGTTRRYTLILFSTGSAYGTSVAGGARVHLDCIGLEDVGDGSGTALTDYFDLYQHVLINFVLQDYQSGAWLTNPQFLFSDGVTNLDRVDATSFDTASTVAALSLTGGRLGSFTIAERASVRDVIARFNLSGGCLLAQDDYQRLFVKVLDVRRTEFLTDRYSGLTHDTLVDKRDFLPGFTVTAKPEWQVNWLRYQYAKNDYTGTYERGGDGSAAPTYVEDTTSQARDGVIKKTIAFDYVADDATATDVASYYLDLFKDMPRVAQYTRRGLCGLEDDLLQGVPITHFNGYGQNGWADHAVWVLSKSFDPKTMTCSFTALDVEPRLAAEEAAVTTYLTSDPVATDDLVDDTDGVTLLTAD